MSHFGELTIYHERERRRYHPGLNELELIDILWKLGLHMDTARVYCFLVFNLEWHKPSELVEKGLCSRMMAYRHIHRLDSCGLLEVQSDRPVVKVINIRVKAVDRPFEAVERLLEADYRRKLELCQRLEALLK